MKKSNVQSLSEIKAADITAFGDFLEQALSVVTNDFLQVASGVVSGLTCTSGSVNTVSCATGHIFMNNNSGWYAFGQLEAASGITISLPVSGTRTDLIAAYYQEITDTPVSGWVLLDPVTQVEQIQNINSRRFGACKISLLTGTTASTCPANMIPLCEVTSSTTTITGLSDVRSYAYVRRFIVDIKQLFYGTFFGAM